MATNNGGRVDVNKADHDELVALPGIGPAGAEAIIKHRKQHGPFKSFDDLAAVPGIGANTVDSLKGQVASLNAAGKQAAEPEKQAAAKATEIGRASAEAGTTNLKRVAESATSNGRTARAAGADVADGAADAGRSLFDAAPAVSRAWLTFWTEQWQDGVQAMQAMAATRSWQDAITIQQDFTRSSFERALSTSNHSAKLLTEAMTGGFASLRDSADQAAHRFGR